MLIHLELEKRRHPPRSADPSDHRRIAFERFDYSIDASLLFDARARLRPSEMEQAQLTEQLEIRAQAPSAACPRSSRPTIHRRLAIPFAPFVFAALGVPLGLRRSRAARSWGVLVCVVLVAVYYTLLSFGQFMGESGRLPRLDRAVDAERRSSALASIPLLRSAQRGMT